MKRRLTINLKKPIRQCIACRKELDRACLVRLTRILDATAGDSIVINPDKYQIGRSAYICKEDECIKKAIRNKRLAKLLKTSSEIVQSILCELESLTIQKKEVLLAR